MNFNDVVLRETNKRNGAYIYRSAENELLCRKIKDGKIDKNAEILADISGTDFDAVIDEENTLHIVVGSAEGNVTYLRKVDSAWKRASLFKPKEGFDTSTENFFVFKNAEEIMVIYIIFYGGKSIICNQKISDTIEDPIVLAQIDRNTSFFAQKNEKNEIFVFYTDDETGGLGYRVYSCSTEGWSDFNIIMDDGRGVLNVFAVSDSEQVFVCYRHKGGIQFRSIGKNGEITDSRILTRKHVENCSELILNCRDNLLRLFWRDESIMICAVRDNSNQTWSRLAERDTKNKGDLSAFKLCDAMKSDCVYDCAKIEGGTVKIHELGDYFEKKSVAEETKQETKREDDVLEKVILKLKILLAELEEMKKRQD